MTKKDFIILAEAIRLAKPFLLQDQATWHKTQIAISEALQMANPNFQRARFDTACGVV